MNNLITLIARILMAQVFLLAGLGKLGENFAATQTYMESMGTPGFFLPLVIGLEIIGGMALLLGYLNQWFALALAGFCVLSALIFHHNFTDQIQMIMFLKDFAMAGGLLLLSVHGAGAWSLDAKWAADSN